MSAPLVVGGTCVVVGAAVIATKNSISVIWKQSSILSEHCTIQSLSLSFLP